VAPPLGFSQENRYLGWKQSVPPFRIFSWKSVFVLKIKWHPRLCFLMKIDIWAKNKVAPPFVFSPENRYLGWKQSGPPFRIFSWKSVFGLKIKWHPPFVFSHENRYLGWKLSGTPFRIFSWKSIFGLKTKCPPFRIFSWKSIFGLKTKWTPL